MSERSRFVAIRSAIIVASVLIAITLYEVSASNIANAEVMHAWMGLRPTDAASNILCAECIWKPSNWGRALGRVEVLDAGAPELILTKNNSADFLVVQRAIGTSPVPVSCSADVLGSGFLDIRGARVTGNSYTDFDATSWRRVSLHFSSHGPSVLTFGLSRAGRVNARNVTCRSDAGRVLFAAEPHSSFRQAKLNLRQIIALQKDVNPAAGDLSGAPRMVWGLVTGGTRRTSQGSNPGAEMIGELISGIATMDGALPTQARAAVLQHAVDEVPGSARVHATLAHWLAGKSYWGPAADEYLLSAARETDEPLRGRAEFNAGLLFTTCTGEWQRAIEPLWRASRSHGWEPAPWYYGAANIELARAYAALGRRDEAADELSSVLACSECNLRRQEAGQIRQSLYRDAREKDRH